jgi:magnesium and cobalt transporter
VRADAQVHIEKIEEFFHTSLPEGEYDSLGGLIIQQLGRLPEAGTILEVAPLIFEVLAADKRRVLTVMITRKRDNG